MSFLVHHLTPVFPFTFSFVLFIEDKKARKMNTKRHCEDRAVSKSRKRGAGRTRRGMGEHQRTMAGNCKGWVLHMSATLTTAATRAPCVT